MDFLDLDFEEFSQIEKRDCVKYDFPVVSFFKYKGAAVVVFNKACEKVFDCVKFVKIYGNAEYLVFSPTNIADAHCFRIYYNKRSNPSFACAGIERFAVVGKSYRLHKTKKGFAIKLNEPILNRKE